MTEYVFYQSGEVYDLLASKTTYFIFINNQNQKRK